MTVHTVEQAAAILQISPHTLRRMIRDGVIAASNVGRVGTCRLRVTDKAIDDYLRATQLQVPRKRRLTSAS